MGSGLVGCDPIGVGEQVQAEVTFAPERIRIVVDVLVESIRCTFVLAEDRPHKAVRHGVIFRRLDPADHFHLGKPAGDAILVGFLDAFLQVLQEVVGIPILGGVVLDITFVDVVDHHQPAVVLAGAEHEAHKRRIVDDIAERTVAETTARARVSILPHFEARRPRWRESAADNGEFAPSPSSATWPGPGANAINVPAPNIAAVPSLVGGNRRKMFVPKYLQSHDHYFLSGQILLGGGSQRLCPPCPTHEK